MSAHRLLLLDSIGYITEHAAGTVIVCGSHGGTSAAGYVLNLQRRPRAVLFNDAGFGKDRAGVAGLPMLQAAGIICAAYSHLSARIGEAADALEHGLLTELNGAAAQAGLSIGMTVPQAVAILTG